MKKKIILSIVGVIFILLIILTLISSSKPKIALIEIKGVISEYYDTVMFIDKAMKDNSVKAVVINVNSPGGAVAASQEIYRAIEKLRQTKPVVISMGNLAASGGYYVSLPANVIYANAGTITGSIGVIIQHTDATELLNKIGIKIQNIKSGKNKDILYPNHKLKPEEEKLIKETIIDVYEQFLEAVSKNRKINKEKLRPIADGRIFSGRQALKLGLIDKIGNLQDAISEARKLAGKEGQFAVLVKYSKQENILKKLLKGEVNINISVPSGIYYLMSF